MYTIKRDMSKQEKSAHYRTSCKVLGSGAKTRLGLTRDLLWTDVSSLCKN